MIGDLTLDLSAILQLLLRRIQLTKNNLEYHSWVLGDLLLTEDFELVFETRGQADPFGTIRTIAHAYVNWLDVHVGFMF